ncbi:MAG: hypothetical protein QM778_22455 [Myxococcales bacterium]
MSGILWTGPPLYTAENEASAAETLVELEANRVPELPAAQGNAQSRAFPNDAAVVKLFFLAIQNAEERWKAPKEWSSAVAHLDFVFEGRLAA